METGQQTVFFPTAETQFPADEITLEIRKRVVIDHYLSHIEDLISGNYRVQRPVNIAELIADLKQYISEVEQLYPSDELGMQQLEYKYDSVMRELNNYAA
ncbi:hypothetical protein KW801_00950 [Candidatus Saccharibacteria bacterium]|nr:hypothetical protein [Candidatus Saccharibacteria bacterium]